MEIVMTNNQTGMRSVLRLGVKRRISKEEIYR